MSQINALIAGVGGPQPPAWDYNEARGAGLRNQLLEQQVEAQPFKRALDEASMQLREEALKLKATAIAQSTKENISIDYPNFTISGKPQSIAEVADAVARFPEQASGPDFMAYLAKKGVSLTKPKDISKSPEIGKTRTIQQGGTEVTQEWTGTEWKEAGRGPKWNPREAKTETSWDERAYQDWIKKPENTSKGRDEFKKFMEKSTYAPKVETYVNTETGESKDINIVDPNAIKAAVDAGFTPLDPEKRGYMLEIGKKNAEAESKINDESKAARGQITTLKTLDELLDRFETGKLAKVKRSLQQYANSFNIPLVTEGLSDKEVFSAITEQLALQSRNQGEGMVLAGQMSDRDVQFLRDMNPQLVISQGGNKKLIRIRIAIAKRQGEVAKLMREYKTSKKGRFDKTGFDAYLEQNFGKQSIFGIPEGSKLVGNDSKTGLPVYQTPDGKMIIPSF